jgi:uncharacterized protein with HEPN domain
MRSRIGDKQRLEHIVQAAEDLHSFVDGLSYETFANDRRSLFASVRAIEIIGEASRHISDELKQHHPNVMWRQATEMRNFVIHQYFDVDNASLWVTATESVPAYRSQIAQILIYAALTLYLLQ